MTSPDEEYFAAQATDAYFRVNAARSRGTLPEKESTKAAAAIARLNAPDASVFLDAGCSSGHLLRSLLSAGLPVRRFVGVDLDEPAIQMARAIWAEHETVQTSFHVSSVSAIPLDDKSVDVSISLNVLEHMRSPRPTLEELVRVTQSLVIIRTSVWEGTYIIQEVRNAEQWTGENSTYAELPPPGDELSEAGEPRHFVYQNMWGRHFIEEQIRQVQSDAAVLIESDSLFSQDALRDDTANTRLPHAARVVDGQQVVGPLILPHCWVLIRLDGQEPRGTGKLMSAG